MPQVQVPFAGPKKPLAGNDKLGTPTASSVLANSNMTQLNRPSHPQVSDSLPFPGIDPLVTLKLPKPGFF
ncbi:hypothetical protein KCV05_g23254, partial [Aureobasidium melanogenum]